MKRAFVLVVLLACAKEKEKAKAPPPAPAAKPAPAPPPATPAPKIDWSAKLGEHDGIVFAEKPGELVKSIPDGTRVEIVAEKPMGVGAYDDATVTVKHDGKDVELPADRVLRESELQRAPDGRFAIFTAITGCGDACHSVVYIIAADGRREKLGEAGAGTTVSWTKDRVAIGNHQLWIAELDEPSVIPVMADPDYTSPAFAPDGTLYVRDRAGNAFIYVESITPVAQKQVYKAPKKAKPDIEDLVFEPKPVTFPGGKPKFD